MLHTDIVYLHSLLTKGELPYLWCPDLKSGKRWGSIDFWWGYLFKSVYLDDFEKEMGL